MIYHRAQARLDIIEAAIWYAEQTSDTDSRFLDALEKSLNQLERYPLSGAEWLFSNPLLKDIRYLPVTAPFQDYLLFYLAVTNGIELVRVLHSRRDIHSIV